MRIASAAVAMMAIVTSGCGSRGVVDTNSAAAPLSPAQRAVRIETTGCGYASARTGSGVAVGDGLVLTVAHLVARSDGIEAAVGGGEPVTAVVGAIDLQRDLAVLRIPRNAMPDIEMSSLGVGAQGLIVSGAASGTVPFEVKQVVELTIEEILGTARHGRMGYELRAETATGDSGAGAYDDTGRLIGIVFATGQDGESSWITSSSEIGEFLAAHGGDETPVVCDAAVSHLDVGER